MKYDANAKYNNNSRRGKTIGKGKGDVRAVTKEKTEPKIEFAETGLFGLDIKVPGLTPINAEPIIRDIRRTLENCGQLSLLDEFAVTLSAEYVEIPVEGQNR